MTSVIGDDDTRDDAPRTHDTHSDGFSTLYAHQSSLAVSSGQAVQAGQVIGYEGSTGNVTGSHLHFEVRANGQPRDPCPYIGC